MQININILFKKLYAVAFLGCVAVLPMSDTIALRNIFLVSMLLIIFLELIYSSGFRRDLFEAIKIIPLPLILWILYLCLFPLWAPIPEIAWQNLRGQWAESVVAWVAGLGAAVLLSRTELSLWKLGIACAFPLLVHLLLAGISYFGIFSAEYYGNQNLGGLFSEISHWFHGKFNPSGQHHPISSGFVGIETQQGNLGYASSMAIGIFSVQFFYAKRTDNVKEMMQTSAAILLCFLSVLIGRTRGGFIFGLLMIGLAAIAVKLSDRSLRLANIDSSSLHRYSPRKHFILASFALILICISYLGTTADPRWKTMVDKVKAGFSIADPISTLCKGLSSAEELIIRERFALNPESYVQEVIDGVKGQDGGRVILMRAGVQLVLKNPMGLDGSRQSYERLIRVECDGAPVLNFANVHNSWIDLCLSLGWPGALLFAALLLFFVKYSFLDDIKISLMPFVSVLLIYSTFWIIRGLFDAVYREHYLQMQALMIGYLYMASVLNNSRLIAVR